MTDALKTIERDNEGYFLNPDGWNEELMAEIAIESDLELTPEHHEIIHFIRHYFEENAIVPEARKILKYMKQQWGSEKATRKYLYKLFPYGYGQQACKIAGMRKPLKLMLDV